MRAVWAFFTVYAFVFVILMLTLIFLGLDEMSAFSAVATCINNMGPGLGVVSANFASVSAPVKLVCAFTCILGRLGSADDLRAVHPGLLARLTPVARVVRALRVCACWSARWAPSGCMLVARQRRAGGALQQVVTAPSSG